MPSIPVAYRRSYRSPRMSLEGFTRNSIRRFIALGEWYSIEYDDGTFDFRS